MKRIRIILFGLFPTTFSTCAPCCPSQYFFMCDPAEEVGEYGFSIRKNQDFLTKAISELSVFRGMVNFEVVGADSIRGLLLSLRYGLGTGPAIIVGKKVFKGEELDIGRVKSYIKSILSH